VNISFFFAVQPDDLDLVFPKNPLLKGPTLCNDELEAIEGAISLVWKENIELPYLTSYLAKRRGIDADIAWEIFCVLVSLLRSIKEKSLEISQLLSSNSPSRREGLARATERLYELMCLVHTLAYGSALSFIMIMLIGKRLGRLQGQAEIERQEATNEKRADRIRSFEIPQVPATWPALGILHQETCSREVPREGISNPQ